jgi:hypothetical protein
MLVSLGFCIACVVPENVFVKKINKRIFTGLIDRRDYTKNTVHRLIDVLANWPYRPPLDCFLFLTEISLL